MTAQNQTAGQSPAPDFAGAAQTFDLGGTSDLIRRIEGERDSRVLVLTYNDKLNMVLAPASFTPLVEVIREIGHVPRLDLFLRSTGGMAEVPWRIISLLREYCQHLSILVADLALSGATHIAIGGDELVMTPTAFLGPVDPTRNHPLLPRDTNDQPIPTSVQDLKHLIEFIREQLGASYESQDLARIMTELFKYVNPLAIGALEQSYNLSRLITKKILGARNEPLDDAEVDAIVDHLGGEYFSHAFFITRRDVEEDLGLSVTKPEGVLLELLYELDATYKREYASPRPAPGGAVVARLGGAIQSRDQLHVIAHLVHNNKILGDPWVRVSQGGGQ